MALHTAEIHWQHELPLRHWMSSKRSDSVRMPKWWAKYWWLNYKNCQRIWSAQWEGRASYVPLSSMKVSDGLRMRRECWTQ
jgi:hypothetical protein